MTDKDFLKHFGIKGMRWGRRSRRNSDSGGRSRSGRKTASPADVYKNRNSYSTKQLAKKVERLKLERDLRQLSNSNRKKGSDYANTILAYGTTAATAYGIYKSPLGQTIKKAVEKKLQS
jgi:hypothetical protein